MMIIALLIKFIYMLRIHMKQNINVIKKHENAGLKCERFTGFYWIFK